MAPQRKNDSVVNIDAWSEDEERSVVPTGKTEAETDAPGELDRRSEKRTLPPNRELLRNEFPED